MTDSSWNFRVSDRQRPLSFLNISFYDFIVSRDPARSVPRHFILHFGNRGRIINFYGSELHRARNKYIKKRDISRMLISAVRDFNVFHFNQRTIEVYFFVWQM